MRKKREARALAALFFLLGLSWLFGALINTGDSSSSLAFQYLFAIFTSLQGFGVFVFNCLGNSQVWCAVHIPALTYRRPWKSTAKRSRAHSKVQNTRPQVRRRSPSSRGRMCWRAWIRWATAAAAPRPSRAYMHARMVQHKLTCTAGRSLLMLSSSLWCVPYGALQSDYPCVWCDVLLVCGLKINPYI